MVTPHLAAISSISLSSSLSEEEDDEEDEDDESDESSCKDCVSFGACSHRARLSFSVYFFYAVIKYVKD